MIPYQGLISEICLGVHGSDVGNFCVMLQNNWDFSVLFQNHELELEFENSNESNNYIHTH